MGKITLIIGGARSGKSTLAQKLAEDQIQDVLYVATAQGLDEEMVDRIERHRSQRPSHWRTLEAPAHISQVLSGTSGRRWFRLAGLRYFISLQPGA